jgi:hypothetical protein
MKRRISLPAMTSWQIFIRSSLLCGMFVVVIFGLTFKRIEPIPLSSAPLKFTATQAYDYMRHLSKNFPNRVTWGAPRKKAGDWLKSELRKMGYSPKSLNFSEVIAGKQYTDMENIYVEKRGTTHPNEIIVAMAHYDVVDTTSEGAMDDASGVGVVLELARLFAREPSDRTLLFLFTDSEEYGAFWGATAFAQSYEQSNQIVAAANFDFIAPEQQTKILTLCDGLKSGYTPLWLREIALNSIRSLGTVEAMDLDGFEEFIERAMQIPPADHGAFLAAGIPAFNWVGQTDHFAYVMAHYHHTRFDVAEAISEDAFESFGKAAERAIRTIDGLPRIPIDYKDSSYWKVSPNYYIPGWAVIILHLLAFIPFLAYSISKFSGVFRSTSKTRVLEVLQNEAKIMSILLGSLLTGYAMILLLPALRVITLYENFPATQKSLILYSPNFLAILLVIVGILIVYWIFHRIFIKPNDSEGYVEIRHALHAALLTFIIFLAFLKNSYLAVLLLLPPAYFWTAIRARRRTEHRIINGLLLLGGAITFLAVSLVLTTIFHVGVVYWYIFLAAAYGLISAYSVVLFFMALTVMIRLFRSFVL